MKAALLALLVATLPASGPISSGNVQTEFARGGVNPISLSEYYKGGASGYVLTTDTAPNVPASGAISLGQFHGAARNVALSAGVTDAVPSGTCNNPTSPYTCTATTGTTTCSGTGGVPSYTYSWAYVSGHTGFTISPNSTSATVSWTHSAANQVVTAVWRCTVTDSTNATAAADVTVTMDHAGL